MKLLRLSAFVFLCLGILGLGLARAQTTADVEARRAELQVQLEAEERAIAEQTKLLEAKQRDTATVSGEVNLLKSQIAQAQANIKAKKVAILRLTDDINARQTKIKTLANKIESQQASLGELLRQVRDIQQLSFVEIMLDSRNLVSVFRDIDTADTIQIALDRAFREMRASQAEAREEQLALEQKKNAEYDAQQTIETERTKIQKREAEKQILLSINKTQEKSYAQVLAERQRRAAKIRAALFALRDTAAIPFGKALEFATAASQKTSVRPAFLLAVLKQESDLGANVGQCFLRDLTNGSGVGKNTGRYFQKVMKPDRDIPHFLRLGAALGFDPLAQVISCPQSVGYGGAMGPAQFIPSTWSIYEDKLKQILGLSSAPNPWEPRDAFMASALFLADLGAVSGSYSAEREAAARYYAGSGWATRGLSYADSVLAQARDIQINMIDPLQNS